MRVLILTPAVLLLLAAGGCSSTTGGSRYSAELQRLSQDCTARGGILSATAESTGRPQVDYACRITGGASRLSSNR